MAIGPQLVCRWAVQRAAASMRSDGRSSSPSGLGRGRATRRQADVVGGDAAGGGGLLLSDEPQPARSTSPISEITGRTAAEGKAAFGGCDVPVQPTSFDR